MLMHIGRYLFFFGHTKISIFKKILKCLRYGSEKMCDMDVGLKEPD